MKRFEDKVKEYIKEYKMIDNGGKVIVGLSGGADSVCLLLVLEKLGFDVKAVHINHMLRGSEADEDEKFCIGLCKDMGIPFVAYHKDIKALASEEKLTVEEAGRKFRYECFEEQAGMCGGARIAVAHNKNDFVETVIFNMSRGTGLNGLSGIKPVRGNIIRPLLGTERKEIEDYLEKMKQPYRIDSTNLSKDYDRNKIRHIIIPTLLDMNQGTVNHIYDLAKEAEEDYGYIKKNAEEEYKKHLIERKDCETVVLSVTGFNELEKSVREMIIHEAIGEVAGRKKDITRRHINDVLSLFDNDTGKNADLPYGIRARISYDKLIISNKEKQTEGFSMEIDKENINKKIEYKVSDKESIEMWVEEFDQDTIIIKNDYTKMADYDKIKDTLCIRTPKEGDYIIIDNEGNSKKLSRVFIDGKVDREERLTLPVIACENQIVWAVGLRYSEAFKIDDTTKKVLYIKYKQI